MLNQHPDDITEEILDEFLQRKLPEGPTLDYKLKFSSQDTAIKSISAMANSYGGWIIVGINEGGQDAFRRGLPGDIIGVNDAESEVRGIEQSCLQAILPMVIPDISVCTIKSKKVILIRVGQSDATPHECLFKDKRRVYVREFDKNHPLDLDKEASVPNLEMLLNRRQKSLDLKKMVIERALNRCHSIAKPRITVGCIPAYPGSPMFSYSDLRAISRLMEYWGAFRNRRDALVTVNEGIIIDFPYVLELQTRKIHGSASVDTDIHGSFIIQATTQSQETITSNMPIILPLYLLTTLLQSAKFSYGRAGYFGSVDIFINFEKADGSFSFTDFNGHKVPKVVGSKIQSEITSDVSSMSEIDTFHRIAQRFLWAASFGAEVENQKFHENGQNLLQVQLAELAQHPYADDLKAMNFSIPSN